MPEFKFSRAIKTAQYGDVTDGQVVDVSQVDADRFERGGWGTKVAKPAPVKRPANKKKGAS